MNTLRAKKARAHSTTIGFRDTETGQSFRPVDVTDYVPDDLSDTPQDQLEALSVAGTVDVAEAKTAIDNATVTRTFDGNKVAESLAEMNGIEIRIVETERDKVRLKQDLLNRKLNPSTDEVEVDEVESAEVDEVEVKV
jgi:hypothetical protein